MNLFKRKPKPPCKHYWIKDVRVYYVSEYRKVVEEEAKWKCNKCREWQEDLIKNNIKYEN